MRKPLLPLGITLVAVVLVLFAVLWVGRDRSGPLPGESGPEAPTGGVGTPLGAPGVGPEAGRRRRTSLADLSACAVSGRVWREGMPAAARVEACPAEAGVAAQQAPLVVVEAGKSGAFRLRGLPVGSYEVRAIGPEGAAVAVPLELRHPGQRAALELTLPAGPHRLRGRVTYADGRPFRGRVKVLPAGRKRGEPGPLGVETDGEGRFTAAWLEAGLVRVRCMRGEEFTYLGRYVRIPHGEELLVVVDRDARELGGRVTAAGSGRPLAGAEVAVTGDTAMNRSCRCRTRTGEDGGFRLKVFPVWRRIEVRAEDFSPVEREIEEGEDFVAIRLDRAGGVTGRVLTAKDGAPLAGVPVHWRPLDPYHLLPGGRVVSGAGGRYTLRDLPPGRVMLFARGGGRVSPGLAAVREGGANPLVLKVAPGAVALRDLVTVAAVRVRGRVVDGEGRPVPGVPVRAKRIEECDLLSDRAPERVSGSRGEFRFDGLVPGVPFLLQASPPGRAPVRGPLLEGAAGEELAVTLPVPSARTPPRWLDLSVVELDGGEPVAGARVSAGGREGRTSSRGRARIGPLPAGRISVWVFHPDYALRRDRPLLEEGATGLVPLTVRLRRGLAIAGRVFLPDGRPLENGTVSVEAVDTDKNAPGRSESGAVAAGGRFRAGGLLAGRYKVKIGGTGADGGYWVRTTAAAGREDLVLTAERRVGTKGRPFLIRVLDTGGKPVPRATAQVRFRSGERSWSDKWPVRDGTCRQEIFWPRGTLTLSVHGARTFSGAVLPLGSRLRGPIPLEAGGVTIRLPAEKRITGVVRAAGGGGVAGVKLTARAAHAEKLEFEEDQAVAYSDGRGTFCLGGLGEGAYRLTLAVPGAFLPHEPLSAEAGRSDLEITLTRGGSCRLTVLDPGGSPLPGARIDLEEEEGRSFTRFTRRDGVGMLRGMDPKKRISLTVSPPSTRGELLPLAQEGWRPRDETIRLAAGLPVAGRVRGPEGRPAAGAQVRARSEGGLWRRQVVARDGRFRLGPFPPGSVTLWAGWPDFRPYLPAPEKVVVAAGREDVQLTVEPGRTLTLRITDWDAAYGPARARLTGLGPPRWALVDREGKALFPGLPAKRSFTLWVGPVGKGLYLLRRTAPGEQEVAANLLPGRSLTGLLILPPGARNPEVRIDGPGYSMAGLVDDGGAFCFAGVPPGRCVVTARAELEGRSLQGHAWAEPGEGVRIELGTSDG